MLDAIGVAFSAWRTVAHISEWTGLSIGALAVLAGLVYLDPRLLKPALIAAGVLTIGYAGILYGDAKGRADVEAHWADARKAAIAAAEERDAMAEQSLTEKFTPQLSALERESRDNKERADAYEHQILSAKDPAAGRCELGAAAERVRDPVRDAQPRGRPPGRQAAGVLRNHPAQGAAAGSHPHQ